MFAAKDLRMATADPSWSDEIRGLLEEADRIRRESERVRSQLDRSMKQPFWPERRRTVRVPPVDDTRGRGDEDP